MISLAALLWGMGARAQEPFLKPAEGAVVRYRAEVTFGQVRMSGIMAVRAEPDRVAGSLMNEFGIKAFDFECRDGRARVENAAGPLGRRPVRRTIEADMARLFCGAGRRRTYRYGEENGAAVLDNLRRGIRYELRPLESAGGENIDRYDVAE